MISGKGLKNSLDLVGPEALDKDANLCSAVDKDANLCSAGFLASGGVKRGRIDIDTVPSAFEDDRAASDNGEFQRGGTDACDCLACETLADRVISEQLSYEAVGGDTTALFDTATWPTRTLPFECTEVASSSTSAPIYAIPNVVSQEPPAQICQNIF